ncbi:MAG: hypothetical protein RID53_05590 [Coleofasciculus sp. B1-GNL1-01]
MPNSLLGVGFLTFGRDLENLSPNYSVSNWEPLVKVDIEQQCRVSAKRKR